jgi:hypothetical protein
MAVFSFSVECISADRIGRWQRHPQPFPRERKRMTSLARMIVCG